MITPSYCICNQTAFCQFENYTKIIISHIGSPSGWEESSWIENWGCRGLKTSTDGGTHTGLRVSSRNFYLIIHKSFYFSKVTTKYSHLIFLYNIVHGDSKTPTPKSGLVTIQPPGLSPMIRLMPGLFWPKHNGTQWINSLYHIAASLCNRTTMLWHIVKSCLKGLYTISA